MRTPVLERPHSELGGIQRLYRFANGYGASVVRGRGTYGEADGLWELAVVKWVPTGRCDHSLEGWSFRLCYDTPLTDDVLGWLSEAEVDAALERIETLEGEGSLCN